MARLGGAGGGGAGGRVRRGGEPVRAGRCARVGRFRPIGRLLPRADRHAGAARRAGGTVSVERAGRRTAGRPAAGACQRGAGRAGGGGPGLAGPAGGAAARRTRSSSAGRAVRRGGAGDRGGAGRLGLGPCLRGPDTGRAAPASGRCGAESRTLAGGQGAPVRTESVDRAGAVAELARRAVATTRGRGARLRGAVHRPGQRRGSGLPVACRPLYAEAPRVLYLSSSTCCRLCWRCLCCACGRPWPRGAAHASLAWRRRLWL